MIRNIVVIFHWISFHIALTHSNVADCVTILNRAYVLPFSLIVNNNKGIICYNCLYTISLSYQYVTIEPG